MNASFFESLVIVMTVALVIAMVFRHLRLPNILAYLVAGCLAGPHVTGAVPNPQDFTFLAEFGVVFLLFSLGLEFSFPRLLALKSSVFGVGSVQVLCCTLLFSLAVYLWGATWHAAIVIAGALALSSTAIVTRELGNLQQVSERHGQLAVGVLLFQDLAAVVFLILVPVLAGGENQSLGTALAWALAKGIVLFVILMSVGKWLLPLLYKEIARSRSEEIFVLSTLVIVLLAAWLTHSFHLSMALGGFIIGMMLGESHYRHQLNSDIRGFKDILLGLFFVTIGMNIQVDLLFEFWPRLIIFAFMLFLVKALVIGFVVEVLGDGRETALKTGLNLAQAGEFSIALLALGELSGVLPSDQSSFIILVVILTMAVSSLVIRNNQRLARFVSQRIKGSGHEPEYNVHHPKMHEEGHVIIGGYGRIGKTVTLLLEANQIPYIVVEHNIDVVEAAQEHDHNVIYGDSTNMELLRSCHISQARLAVLAFKSLEDAKALIQQVRANGINIPIIVRCYEHEDVEELISLGASRVVPEMLEASMAIGAQVLQLLKIEDSLIQEQLSDQRKGMNSS